jgi:hypothetical protein
MGDTCDKTCPKCTKFFKLKCKFCEKEYCSRCISIDIHLCSRAELKKKIHLENLSKQNVVVTTSKIVKI